MKRLVAELDGVLVRQAAALAGEIRDGLRASLSVDEVLRKWAETHRDSVSVTPNEARAWARTNLTVDNSQLDKALTKVYGVGGVLGYDASLQAYAKASLSKAVDPKDIASALNIDWKNWQPGNRASAFIANPRGGFARLFLRKSTVLDGLSTTTLNRVGTALSAGLAMGLTDEQIAAKFVDVIGSSERALTIATTEMNSAMSVASMDNYQELGVGQVEWLGLDACEICQPNIDQGPIDIGAEFESGDTEPPGHGNCRCTILPVIVSDVNLADRADLKKFVPNKTDAELAQARLATLPAVDGLVDVPWPVVETPHFDLQVWDTAVLEVVELVDLFATSPRLKVKKVAKHIDALGQALKPYRTYALVIEKGGAKIIVDGHHRLMSQWLLGQQFAPIWKVII